MPSSGPRPRCPRSRPSGKDKTTSSGPPARDLEHAFGFALFFSFSEIKIKEERTAAGQLGEQLRRGCDNLHACLGSFTEGCPPPFPGRPRQRRRCDIRACPRAPDSFYTNHTPALTGLEYEGLDSGGVVSFFDSPYPKGYLPGWVTSPPAPGWRAQCR